MTHRIGTPGVIKILRRVLAEVRDEVRREGVVSGRRWRRPDRHCPGWCASDHTCTAKHGYPTGQHRSPPTTWHLPWGRLVATRVASLHKRPSLELRVVVDLDGVNDQHALEQSLYLPIATSNAVAATLAELGLRHRPRPVADQAPRALPYVPRRVVDGATVSRGGTPS